MQRERNLRSMRETTPRICAVSNQHDTLVVEERGKDAESKFLATHKKVSNDEYDDDFLERANDDMGIILTFVCSFLLLSMQV